MVIKKLSDRLKSGDVSKKELTTLIYQILERLEALESDTTVSINKEIEAFFK